MHYMHSGFWSHCPWYNVHMQTSKTTNVLLGIIALALVVIIVLFAVHENAAAPTAPVLTTPTGSAGATTDPQQVSQTTTSTTTTTPVVAAGMKPYTDASFGFALAYPQADTATATSTGTSIAIPGSEEAITVVKTTNTAPDPSGKWGPYTISYSGTGYVVQEESEETGSMTSTPISPIAYTASGLPIFNGTIPSHGYGKYDYIVALSHTKFLTISGPDTMGTSSTYNAATDPTLAVAESVTAQ